MKKVLLSIKPEFADKIFAGTKKYEFRRKIFKDKNIETIIVYASSPVQKVIGEFSVDKILSGTPNWIWQSTSMDSGITQEFFDEYYENRNIAFAIKIRDTKKYDVPKDLMDYDLFFAPQSFVYVG